MAHLQRRGVSQARIGRLVQQQEAARPIRYRSSTEAEAQIIKRRSLSPPKTQIKYGLRHIRGDASALRAADLHKPARRWSVRTGYCESGLKLKIIKQYLNRGFKAAACLQRAPRLNEEEHFEDSIARAYRLQSKAFNGATAG